MRSILKACWHLCAIVGVAVIAAAISFARDGVTTRTEPSAIETTLGRAARHALIPASVRERQNPQAATPEGLRVGLEHWADHCASCHANDGSGDTSIGRSLYPRVPDMRSADTQQLSDGELFYLIEHGVKLTGMPAWGTGTAEGEAASWQLVHFIRRLPALDAAELADMEDLNPRSAEEWRALEEERRFLAGEPQLPAPSADSPHRHKGEPQ
jgi:mono/diheme cytochrome c family protein